MRAAVEITKQGVWAARRLPDLAIPQLNCAETRLKELEGPLVGDAVVHALDLILRDVGYALWGRTALVLGHGWVGRGVCQSLRAGIPRVPFLYGPYSKATTVCPLKAKEAHRL